MGVWVMRCNRQVKRLGTYLGQWVNDVALKSLKLFLRFLDIFVVLRSSVRSKLKVLMRVCLQHIRCFIKVKMAPLFRCLSFTER